MPAHLNDPLLPAAFKDDMWCAATAASTRALASRSWRHAGLPCVAHVRITPGIVAASGVPFCDLGCLDDLVPVIEVALAKGTSELTQRGSLPPFSWFCSTAARTESDRRRASRVTRGLPSRFDRLATTAWMQAALPGAADRALLVHVLAWAASDGPAAPGTVWPAESWVTTYGQASASAVLADIDRVVATFAAFEPAKHQAWLAIPLAAKVADATPGFVSLEVSLARAGVDSFGEAA